MKKYSQFDSQTLAMSMLFLFLIPIQVFGQVPAYYTGIDFSYTGNQLEQDLSALVIATHRHELVYTPEVWHALRQTDIDPENHEKVLLIYGFDDKSGNVSNHRTRPIGESCHDNDCKGKWVREHVFPKSLGNPKFKTSGPGSDAHQIRAIDHQKNNQRSNRKFGSGKGNSHINSSDGSFYPGDEWKGDVARMMMYMQIRYPERTPANAVGNGPNTYHPEMPDIFLIWNAEDPPSKMERKRNLVLQDMQGNRNPFIDNPYLATVIWGGPNALNTWKEIKLSENHQQKTKVFLNSIEKTLNIDSNLKINQVSLFNQTGLEIFSKRKLKKDTFDISKLQPGTYLLLIEYKNPDKKSKAENQENCQAYQIENQFGKFTIKEISDSQPCALSR